MMNQNRSAGHQHHEEEEDLKGAFLSSLIVGIIILAIRASIFVLYFNRI